MDYTRLLSSEKQFVQKSWNLCESTGCADLIWSNTMIRLGSVGTHRMCVCGGGGGGLNKNRKNVLTNNKTKKKRFDI